MCNNCNYIPLMNYGEIIAMLVPYCYKNNFPVLQNYVIKSLILRLALCFDPVTPDLSIRKLSLVGIAYIEK